MEEAMPIGLVFIILGPFLTFAGLIYTLTSTPMNRISRISLGLFWIAVGLLLSFVGYNQGGHLIFIKMLG